MNHQLFDTTSILYPKLKSSAYIARELSYVDVLKEADNLCEGLKEAYEE